MEPWHMVTRTILIPAAQVQREIARMSSMVDQAILDSTNALVANDHDLARRVSADDALLNQVRLSVEQHCYATLAAGPLLEEETRAVVGAVNIATNLERIGDHAAGNAHLVLSLNKQALAQSPIPSPIPIPPAISEMSEVAREMVEGAVIAFLTSNDLLAERTVRRGAEAGELYEQIYRALGGFLAEGLSQEQQALTLLWIAHNLERMADRAANICERTIFVATGELKEFR
jgi:phosphate transport system protein